MKLFKQSVGQIEDLFGITKFYFVIIYLIITFITIAVIEVFFKKFRKKHVFILEK